VDDLTRLHVNAMLERDEGRRDRPYLDCCGKPWRSCVCVDKGYLTIGVGYNLDAHPLDEDVIDLLRDKTVAQAERDLLAALPWATGLPAPRFAVLLDMTFNLGIHGLLGFHTFLAAVEAGQWEQAGDAMRDSKWATQVGARATRLERQMIRGDW
jgi:lysozyme